MHLTWSYHLYDNRFVIDARYNPLKGLGRGAYGIVISAYDSITDQKVAIKKIPKMFADLIDAKRILRELKLLRHFQHENIIGMFMVVLSTSYYMVITLSVFPFHAFL